jgi:hypothetical protein
MKLKVCWMNITKASIDRRQAEQADRKQIKKE